MKELKFRIYDKTSGYYVAILDNDYFEIKQVARIILELEMLKHEYIIEQYTGLLDKNGKRICEGDILRFDNDDGIWQAPVVFERGLFGLDVYHPKQIKNPKGWDKTYDRVNTRRWAIVWGYEETGTAFTYRSPLAKATIFNGSPEEYEKSEQKKLYEKYGYGNYYVMAEGIGNIHENPELLGGEE